LSHSIALRLQGVRFSLPLDEARRLRDFILNGDGVTVLEDSWGADVPVAKLPGGRLGIYAFWIWARDERIRKRRGWIILGAREALELASLLAEKLQRREVLSYGPDHVQREG